MNKLFKKLVAPAALVTAAAMMLSGCGSSANSSDDAASARGPITIWLSNNAQEVAWGEEMVESWNAEHPDEQVTAQEIPASSSSEEAITAAITAGTSPCLIYNISAAAVPGWVRQGGLVNLSEFEGADEYIESRTGDSAELYQTDGSYYQMPWKANPVMILYNKDIFEKAGIDPENPGMDTYEGFLEGARKIVQSGASQSAIWPVPTNDFYQPWNDFYPLYLAATGGTPLVEDGEATFDNEAGQEVSELFKTLYDENLAPKEKYTDDPMVQGNTAMQLAGPWAIASYKDNVNVGVMPVPTKDGGEDVTTFADSKNVSMFTTCSAQATAWDFMQYTTSKEADKKFIETTGQIPMREDDEGVFDEYAAQNPDYEPFIEQAQRMSDVPSLTNSTEVWQEFRKLWSSDIIFGGASSEQFVADAASAVNDLVKEG
ncbi:extracellular solute-binding protein [Bifidobacterium eulemuris]|uniref:Extracellular solute-binding protein n=1 Tax=Bifidobacterium eulemuris TaxID=1765219 RepID=A0A261GAX8_9BIFI|nr:extracellular solute-binding protein [Bifidobacterium eulemuris]OZG68560.1 sugar ABC transporter substrate-binding protein [Bifidobacterium eulemuris]QOL32690.1 extracellular solute-binding protein [Bifidobacterium eulemuris]